MPPTHRVCLHEIEVSCYLGCFEHEQAAPRTVEVDVEFALALASRDDALDATFDYGRVSAIAERVAGSRRFALVEALADEIADALAAIEALTEIRVRVTKARPLPTVRAVTVEVQRKMSAHNA